MKKVQPQEGDFCLRCRKEGAPTREAWIEDRDQQYCACVNPVPGPKEADPGPFRRREYRVALLSVLRDMFSP